MEAWWMGLSTLNQGLYGLAVFFSTLFLWQLVAALIGLGGGGEMGGGDASLEDAGPEIDDAPQDASVAAFKLLSMRSIIAFGMLFGWAGALHLQSGEDVHTALLYGLVWGAVAMVVVAYFYRGIQRMTEIGNPSLATCVGTSGEVHIDIPENGTGQVRVVESGVVSYVSARGRDGAGIPNRTPVFVLRTLDSTTVEVEPEAP
jgi:membrane protein implicated in regulation of membrane protease activity